MQGSVSLRLGLFSFLGLAACASTGGLEEEMSRMRRDLAAMKKEVQETQLSVQRLEGRVTLLSLGREQVDRAPTKEVASSAPIELTNVAEKRADAKEQKPSAAQAARGKGAKKGAEKAKHADASAGEQRPPQKVLPVVRLGAKAEVAAEDDAGDQGALDDGSPPIVIQMGPDEGHERIPVDRDVLKKPDPLAKPDPLLAGSDGRPSAKAAEKSVGAREATSAELEAEYTAALSKLRVDAKPAEARALFTKFREQHPRSNLADNAAYWIGECHLAEKSYSEAITAFRALQSEHPRSPKVPDALLKIGESWLGMGDRAKAEAAFKQVIEAYPKSEASQGARARLESLSSSGGR